MLSDDLKALLVEGGNYELQPNLPSYLKDRRYGWVPTFVLRHRESGDVVAFELAYTAELPEGVLLEAKRAQDEHRPIQEHAELESYLAGPVKAKKEPRKGC